jgi:hypothetical protein
MNQCPASCPEHQCMLKYEVYWEPLSTVPIETEYCISPNMEHLKTGPGGRSPGMQDNEWRINVSEASLHVQTHTPLASGAK